MKKTIAIAGGGAAGFFAAANLAELCPELQINIYESGRKTLTKVEISGGGRCNVTHSCFDITKLSQSYPRGRQEMIGPFSAFSPADSIEWFERHGVTLKTEEDGRMFPDTDSSRTIINCLSRCLESQNVKLHLNAGIKEVKKTDQKFTLKLADGRIEEADYLMLATGSGKSGHALATSLGHTITETAPSLFTFNCSDYRLTDLAGTSFENVDLNLELPEGKNFKQSGPLLITHWGLSGPAVLKLSAFAARELAESDYQAELTVNWIAEKNIQKVMDNLISLRKKMPAKEIAANPQFDLTKRFWERLLAFCKIPFKLHFFELSNQQAEKLAEALIRSRIKVEGKGEFKEEFVTCGGVSLREISFKTFESKKVPNLFFAGEVLDIDGITGGFNFQAAWTGGWTIAKAIEARSQ